MLCIKHLTVLHKELRSLEIFYFCQSGKHCDILQYHSNCPTGAMKNLQVPHKWCYEGHRIPVRKAALFVCLQTTAQTKALGWFVAPKLGGAK